jgi:nucleoside-diphosphate-sugar epimerase
VKILVTGGTGFVGSHAVEALVGAGHEVRLLARSREKVDRVMGARGVPIPEVVLGDMTDAGCVRTGLTGCDAVLHAAAEVKIGRSSSVFESNVAGSRNVIGIGLELGLDPIIAVSSIAAMFPPAGAVVTVDDPVAHLDAPYSRSKAEAERYARGLQAAGKPVVSIYPTGVMGPDDPGLGAVLKGLRDNVRFGYMITHGGNGLVDVRDLASIIVAALEPGRGPRRYMAGGHFLSWSAQAALCEQVIGRRVRRFRAAPWVVRSVGRVIDLIKTLIPSFDFPLTYEGSLFMTLFVPSDSQKTVEDLGVSFRPSRETFTDTIRFLIDAGEIEPRHAPALFAAREAERGGSDVL